MIDTNLTKKARAFALERFDGVTDECGHPVMRRLDRVAAQMPDEDYACTAYLQDCLEKFGTGMTELVKKGMPLRVAHAAVLLSYYRDAESYCQAVRNQNYNEIAVTVKLADLAYRSDESNYIDPDPRMLEKIEEYKAAYRMLSQALNS